MHARGIQETAKLSSKATFQNGLELEIETGWGNTIEDGEHSWNKNKEILFSVSQKLITTTSLFHINFLKFILYYKINITNSNTFSLTLVCTDLTGLLTWGYAIAAIILVSEFSITLWLKESVISKTIWTISKSDGSRKYWKTVRRKRFWEFCFQRPYAKIEQRRLKASSLSSRSRWLRL